MPKYGISFDLDTEALGATGDTILHTDAHKEIAKTLEAAGFERRHQCFYVSGRDDITLSDCVIPMYLLRKKPHLRASIKDFLVVEIIKIHDLAAMARLLETVVVEKAPKKSDQ